ncbi:AAA family ATPase [Nocardioides insulae]|uniref:AAA family ATPase n=1 Tax=Nocardioides insulae TaxID=394734 RepID=UPI0004075E5E|nr:AAA family ATPase [Nocardioides insulae]
MPRILVAGVSGCGKSTLARRIASRQGLPYVELDALFHGPDWTKRPSFEADVASFSATEDWVTEWQYDTARPVLLARATTLVWLDLPTARTMWQVTRRTVERRLRRTELWNGNREGPLRTILTDDEHIIRWAWRTRHKYRDVPAQLAATAPHVELVHLRSHAAAQAWLDHATGSQARRPE